MSKFKILVLVSITVICATLSSCGYNPHNNIYIISETQDAYQMKTV